jgi:hypothetical protein
MTDSLNTHTFTLRVPEQLNNDLKSAAIKESATPSELARRLIAAGLKRERRPEPPTGDEAA